MEKVRAFAQGVPQFFREAVNELRLSTWLSRTQVIQTTVVVVLFTMLVALYIGAIDWLLLTIVNPIINPFRR